MRVPEVLGSTTVFQGGIFSVEQARLRFADGKEATRDVIHHPGAVGVVAMDEQGRVLLIDQYRHPAGRSLLELPAGLLDEEGEPASRTAARELAEEVGLRAERWDVLVDALTSSGASDEAVRIYLARGISDAPDTGFVREHEEVDLSPRWVPLVEAVQLVFAGVIVNGLCVMGLLAAERALGAAGSAVSLRTTAAPWPDRPGHQG